MEIILASGSPRRKELLGLICPDFRVEVSGADEHVTETLSPEQLVARLAEKKASEVASRFPETAVIGSDTVVELDGEIFQLQRLSGREHRVHTAVQILSPAGSRSLVSTAEVHFAPMTDREIEWYVSTGEPMDKAGAYGIQERGALLVEGIQGDYFNVVGLPVCLVGQLLARFGVDPFLI